MSTRYSIALLDCDDFSPTALLKALCANNPQLEMALSVLLRFVNDITTTVGERDSSHSNA